jgi:hypothetical protein
MRTSSDDSGTVTDLEREDTMTAGWPASALNALSHEVVLRDFGNFLMLLANEFPAYEFGTQRTWNGVSLFAVRRDGADRAGTYAVVTSDPGEMRQLLTLEVGPVPDRSPGISRTP